MSPWFQKSPPGILYWRVGQGEGKPVLQTASGQASLHALDPTGTVCAAKSVILWCNVSSLCTCLLHAYFPLVFTFILWDTKQYQNTIRECSTLCQRACPPAIRPSVYPHTCCSLQMASPPWRPLTVIRGNSLQLSF